MGDYAFVVTNSLGELPPAAVFARTDSKDLSIFLTSFLVFAEDGSGDIGEETAFLCSLLRSDLTGAQNISVIPSPVSFHPVDLLGCFSTALGDRPLDDDNEVFILDIDEGEFFDLESWEDLYSSMEGSAGVSAEELEMHANASFISPDKEAEIFAEMIGTTEEKATETLAKLRDASAQFWAAQENGIDPDEKQPPQESASTSEIETDDEPSDPFPGVDIVEWMIVRSLALGITPMEALGQYAEYCGLPDPEKIAPTHAATYDELDFPEGMTGLQIAFGSQALIDVCITDISGNLVSD